MRDIEEYLSGDEAVRDVEALLPQPGTSANLEAEDVTEGAWIGTGAAGAWRVCAVGDTKVYFRHEGALYIVTDLGGAAMALRLRTGDYGAEGAGLAPPDGVSVGDGGLLYAADVRAVDLSLAICRVLLAALRVSRLEVA